jgi:hypothetical protein
LPKIVDDYLSDEHSKLVQYAQRTEGLLLWRMGRYDVDGRLYSSFGSFLMWSLNGSPARPIHPEVRISIETQPPPVALPTNGWNLFATMHSAV